MMTGQGGKLSLTAVFRYWARGGNPSSALDGSTLCGVVLEHRTALCTLVLHLAPKPHLIGSKMRTSHCDRRSTPGKPAAMSAPLTVRLCTTPGRLSRGKTAGLSTTEDVRRKVGAMVWCAYCARCQKTHKCRYILLFTPILSVWNRWIGWTLRYDRYYFKTCFQNRFSRDRNFVSQWHT